MRLSLQLMGLVVTDGILPFEINRYHTPIDPNEGPLDIGMQLTASVAIKQLMVSINKSWTTNMDTNVDFAE